MIIFYDAQCPLCNTEMLHLKKADRHQQLILEDLNAADFYCRFPHINKDKAMNLLHGQMASGELIYGLDVTCQAWKTVGKHRWLMLLRLPIIKFFADLGYLFFARHRQFISKLLMPNSACINNQCSASRYKK